MALNFFQYTPSADKYGPVGAPEVKAIEPQQGRFADVVDNLQGIGYDIAGGVSDMLGAEGFAKYFYQGAEDQRETMSDRANAALSKSLIEKDADGNWRPGEGATDFDFWLLNGTGLAGQVALGAIPGAGAASLAAKAGMGAKAIAAARGAGYASVGGSLGMGMAMQEGRQEVMAMPDEVLDKSEKFRQNIRDLHKENPELDADSLWDSAKDRLAEQIAQDIRTDPETLLANYALSAIGDPVIGKALLGSRIAKSWKASAAKGAAVEGSTEALQAGTTQYGVNEALQPIDGRDVWDGVDVAAANEGVMGGVFGAAAGGFGGVWNRQVEPVKDPDADAIRESNPVLAIGFDGIAQDKAKRDADLASVMGEMNTANQPALEGELLGPEPAPSELMMITDKNVIFAGDGRPQQAAQEFTDNLQRQANQAASVPRLPQKDIIFAGDQSGVRVKGNGEVYKSPREAMTSKQARAMKRSGTPVEAVQFGDGWGWRVKESQPEQAQQPDIQPEQIVQPVEPAPIQLMKSGRPFSTEAMMLKSASYKEAAATGAELEPVKVEGGFGFRVKPEPARAAQLQPAIQARSAGKQAVVTTPAGRDIDVEYQVVEADSLVTSNLEDGRSNPDFPPELQPRDRSRAASQDQINRIAGAVNPRLLAESPTTSDGAPVISADGIVESGNGRSLGLKKAYRQGGAEGYRQWLSQNGYDVDGMKQPVLVRVRRTELSPEDRLAYIQESNQRTTLEMSATEQAASDAGKMPDILGEYMGGDITSNDNRGFVRKFMQNVAGEAERGGLMDSTGVLSQAGRRRIEAALLSAAYGDDGIVAEVFESGDTDIKAIGGALLDAAGKWAQMRNAGRDGMIADGMDVTPFMLEAVNLIRRARSEGKALIELVSTDDIFSGTLPDATRAWLSIFYRGDTLSRARGRDKVAQALNDYADEALKTQPGDGLFGDVVTSDQVMGAVNERIKNQEGGSAQQGGLFTAGNADATESRAQSGQERQGSSAERTNGPDREQPEKSAVTAKPTTKTPADAGVSVSGPVEKSTRTEKLQDVGAILLANKKSWFSGMGIKWSDIAGENDTLKLKLTTKSKVWAKPNWESIIDSVPDAERDTFAPIVHMVKQVYDAIATAPSGKSDQNLQDYIEAVTKVKDAAENLLSDKQAQAKLWSELGARAERRLSSPYSIGTMAAKSDMAPIFAKVFPLVADGSKFKRGERENDLAVQLGSKAIKTMQFDAGTAVKALQDISKGWPTKQEAWQKQGYAVVELEGKPEAVAGEIKRPTGNVYSARVNFKTTDGGSFREFLGTFDTEQEALKTANDFAGIYNKPVVLISKRKTVISAHDDIDAATEAARAVTRRNTGKEVKEQPLQAADVERVGVERRIGGRDVTAQELMDSFGFTGINFGNWVKADERQWFVNQTYDSFYDLAEILGLPPKAMSLNGMLGVAFGAQGNSGAAAHFVPGFNEINLTKNQGAGALAHEWGHALDHYFGVMSGMGKSDAPYASELANLDYRIKNQVRGNLDTDGGIRKVIYDAFVDITSQLKEQPETMEQNRARIKASQERALSEFNALTEQFESQLSTAGKDALKALRDGKPGDYADIPPPKGKRKSPGAVYGEVMQIANELPEVLSDLRMINALHSKSVSVRLTTEALSDEPALRRIHTDFYAKSRGKDASKGGKLYWSTPVEMFARAFESFVMDLMAEREQRNDFLVRPGKNDAGETNPEYPYPAGTERKNFNAAFNKLIEVIETKETDKGTMLFSKQNTIKAKPAKGVNSRLAKQFIAGIMQRLNGAAGIKVVVLETQAEAEALWQMSLSGDLVRGAYNRATNTAYVIAENIKSMDELREVVAHEVIGHGGLQNVISKADYKTFIERLKQTRNNRAFAEQWAQIDNDYEGFSENDKAEELFAYFVQNKPVTGPVKLWFNALKRFLHKALVSVGLAKAGDPDIEAMQDMLESIQQGFAAGRSTDSPGVDSQLSFSKTKTSEAVAGAVTDFVGRKRLDPNDPYAVENRRLKEQDRTLWDKAKQVFMRNFAPGGMLPRSIFDAKITRDGELESGEMTIKHLIFALERAVQKDTGKSVDNQSDEFINMMADSLAGKVNDKLGNETKAALVAMRQYIDALSGDYLSVIQAKIDELTKRIKQDDKYTDKAQALNEIELYEKIKGNMGVYVNRSYRAFDDPKWFQKVPVDVINRAREYLIRQYKAGGDTDADARANAEVTLESILKEDTAYSSMESFIAESKLGAKDLSTLIARKDISPEIRELLGEYKDPRMNFAKTATKMARLVWNSRFLSKIKADGMGVFFFEKDNRPPGANTPIAGENSKTYEPLNGLYTFPEVAQALQDSLGTEKMEDWYEAAVKLTSMVKYGKTVLSPTTAMRNWQSAMFFAVANGHFDFKHMKKSLAAFHEQVSQSATGDDLAYLKKLKKLGVVYDAPYAGEMMQLLSDSKIDEWLEGRKGKVFGTARQINNLAQGFYSFGDDFWKIIGYENEKANFISAGLNEAEAEKMAAERIRNTYPTYSMVGRAIKKLARFPLMGTFVSFPAEIIRTTANMLRYAAQDMKSDNPKIRAMARKRLTGMALVSGMFYALSAMTAAMQGVDDEEEEAIRDVGPSWQKNSTFLFYGRDDKGKLQYFDISFLDPYGYFKRPITALLRDQPWEDAAASGAADMLSPFFGADITAGTFFQVFANKKQSGGQVYNEYADGTDQLVSIADHIWTGLRPGFVNNAMGIFNAAAGNRREGSGKEYDLGDEMMALMGWRASSLDAPTALYYRSFDFADQLQAANSTLNKVLRSDNSVDDDDIADAKEEAQRQYDDAFRQMQRIVQSGRNAGMTKEQVYRTLKLSGVSSRNISGLVNGNIPPMQAATLQTQVKAVAKAREIRGDDQASEVLRRFQIARQLQ